MNSTTNIGLAFAVISLVLTVFWVIFWILLKAIKLLFKGVVWITMFPGTQFDY
ncbi:hypothetical protein ABQD49_04155 [Lactococcus petauri]|jgi:hypothetical protein|uniref:hypothetical protein n=1 Tax=Lactococcus petauri TaxID=1940789 RepID=UPI0032E42AFC